MLDSADHAPVTAPARGPAAFLRSLFARLGCSPSEALALAVLLTGAVAGLGLLWMLGHPGTAAPPANETASLPFPAATAVAETDGSGGDGSALGSATGASADEGPGTTESEVIVHVAGQVSSPGLYRLPAGSRIGDALERAGGALPQARLDLVNLAQPLTDGEQVLVPGPDDGAPAGSAAPGVHGTGGGRRADGTLDLNRATAGELEELPGVGPVLAERILAQREAIGGFRTVDELHDVKGIGEKTFAELEPLVAVP